MSNGFINVLKPPGMSSHDVVSSIRKIYKMKKVGHAGTLDPSAAGVLPVALGKATRLIEYMAQDDKSYRAELHFGYATDSGDEFGTVVDQLDSYDLPAPDTIKTILNSFIGTCKQKPPMHSAIKINGNKLCDLARKGIKIDVPEREIQIYAIHSKQYENSRLLFDVDCSKGTYIRSLCMDIGSKIGVPAVMTFLVRTRVGTFHLSNAFTLEELAQSPEKALLPVDSALQNIPPIKLTHQQSDDFQNGKRIKTMQEYETKVYRIYDFQNIFIGIGVYHPKDKVLLPHKVIHH